MKLILSRKGFDSAAGGHWSPILADGRLVSLPIPSAEGVLYSDIRLDSRHTYADLMCSLGIKAVRYSSGHTQKRVPLKEARAHFDPDVDPDALNRATDWRPLFGQNGAAQSHLANQGVGPGDLFLFYGWFQHTEGPLAGVDLHVLWGYLQIAEVIKVANCPVPPWARDHPHFAPQMSNDKLNTVYVASERLSFAPDRSGAGSLGLFRPSLQLTHPGHNRSVWALPQCFHPSRVSMTYHTKPQRWLGDDPLLLQTAARGQEFVLDVDHDVQAWIDSLFRL